MVQNHQLNHLPAADLKKFAYGLRQSFVLTRSEISHTHTLTHTHTDLLSEIIHRLFLGIFTHFFLFTVIIILIRVFHAKFLHRNAQESGNLVQYLGLKRFNEVATNFGLYLKEKNWPHFDGRISKV